MNAANFFNQIRTYINNNATHANDVERNDARTCGANNISVFVGPFKFAGKYELAIEGRNAGRGYVTVRHLTATEHRLIADECTLHSVFKADECNGAVLAILEAQDKLRGEDAIVFGDDVPLQMDVNDDRRKASRNTITIEPSARGYRLALPVAPCAGLVGGFKQLGIAYHDQAVSGTPYRSIPADKLSAVIELLNYWFGEYQNGKCRNGGAVHAVRVNDAAVAHAMHHAASLNCNPMPDFDTSGEGHTDNYGG